MASLEAESVGTERVVFRSFEAANVPVGESMEFVQDIPQAEDLINRIVAEASARLAKFASASAWLVDARDGQSDR
jgi:hypothetical protein